MSSFLHNPEHFNSIEKSVLHLKEKEDRFYNISKLDIVDCINNHRILSATCVINQYKDKGEDVTGRINANIQFLMDNKTKGEILKPIALYKAIQSMEYQIELEHLGRDIKIKEQRSIEILKDIKIDLASLIISGLTEYNKAKWSI